MLENYIRIASRNLLSRKILAAVKVLGLAIGITTSLLILHYVNFEKSYDRYHTDYENIYRLRYERIDDSGEAVRFASCCPPAAARIRGNYSEVQTIGRLLKYAGSVSHGNEVFLEERIYFAEPEILDILTFDFVDGRPAEGIGQPNNTLISQSTARKYFGDADPVGKTISINKKDDYQIVGVFDDLPPNTHLKCDFLLPWKNLETKFGPEYTEAWGHTGSYTYLRVAPGTDPRVFEGKMGELAKAECPWLEEYNMTMNLPMQPVADIHLKSHFMQEYEANGNLESVEALFFIALVIMIMAWVNFVNISTATSINRAREVGVRKVVGASKNQLSVQFFAEVLVLNAIAVAISAGLVEISLPLLSQITGLPTGLAFWTKPWVWSALGIMFFVGVFLSGLFPVFALTSFEPAAVLMSKLRTSRRGILLRKGLVLFQFVVGIVLVVATLVVFEQIEYLQSRDLGFAVDETLVVRAPRVRDQDYGTNFITFRDQLLERTDIARISHVTEVPGKQIYWDAGGIRREGEDETQGKNYQIVGVDYEFADLFDITMVAGRMFSKEFGAEDKALVLNQTAIRFMGFDDAESAIGKTVDYWGEIFTVIGVIEDYHQQSPKMAFEPHLYRFAPYGRGSMGAIAIKLNSQDVRETVAAVKAQYDQFYPGNSFDHFFLDDYYNQQYEADMLFGRVYSIFSILALSIIALGIYGLTSFSITLLTKEIGIRKVLGASIPGVVGLLTKEFVVLVGIANVLAWPIAYYMMSRWLKGFASRMELGVPTFVVAGLSTFLLAMLTISLQVMKAARANPVKALRYE